jgi:hypothetical protein
MKTKHQHNFEKMKQFFFQTLWCGGASPQPLSLWTPSNCISDQWVLFKPMQTFDVSQWGCKS